MHVLLAVHLGDIGGLHVSEGSDTTRPGRVVAAHAHPDTSGALCGSFSSPAPFIMLVAL